MKMQLSLFLVGLLVVFSNAAVNNKHHKQGVLEAEAPAAVSLAEAPAAFSLAEAPAAVSLAEAPAAEPQLHKITSSKGIKLHDAKKPVHAAATFKKAAGKQHGGGKHFGKKAGKKAGKHAVHMNKQNAALAFAKKNKAKVAGTEEAIEEVVYGACSMCANAGSGPCMDRANVCWQTNGQDENEKCPPNTNRCLVDGSVVPFASLNPIVEVAVSPKPIKQTHQASLHDEVFDKLQLNTTDLVYLNTDFACGECASGSSIGVNWVCQNNDNVCFPMDRFSKKCPAQTKDCSAYLGVSLEDDSDDY